MADTGMRPGGERESSQKGRAADRLPSQSQVQLPSQSVTATIYRDIPSISGRYSVGGKTIMPYLGIGFSGGFTSDLNRSLSGPSSVPTDSGLRIQFGQNLSPSEFQMGLRIPF